MNLLSTVFKFERKLTVRQPMMLLAMLLYLSLGSYGIYSGQQLIGKQLSAIDTVHISAQNDLKNALKAFTDTLTDAKKYQAAQAGDPYIINYRMPRIATDFPKALAGLSIGLRDITPLSEKISFTADYSDKSQEITNPVLLFEGKIDLSFIIIFILPLLIIVFCYDLLSSEKEQGTYALLMVQSRYPHHIIFYRIFFRFMLIGTATLLLTCIGILSCWIESVQFYDALRWICAVLSYLIFWFSICFLVISQKKETLNNALYLLGSWLLFLIILPAFTNIYINTKYPPQIQADLEDLERHIGEEVWYSDPAQVVRTFYSTHPQYARAFKPQDTTNNQNDAFFAGYDHTVAEQMSAEIAKIEDENNKANRAARKLLLFSPAQQIQHVLNTLAGTSRDDYLHYQQQVAVFKNNWKKNCYDRIFHISGSERTVLNIKPEELNQLPIFHKEFQQIPIQNFMQTMFPLWILTLLLSLCSYLFLKYKLT